MDTIGDEEVVPMGSSEATGSSSHGSGASSCGPLSSLLPNSCRGRAEAFARRLHRRLTSLGGSKNISIPSDSTITETTWLQSNYKTSEPLLISGASGNELESEVCHESDVFFDHGSENGLGLGALGSPGSPCEFVTAAELADLLVNHSEKLKMNHHDACHGTNSSQPIEDCHENKVLGCIFPLTIDDHTSEENSSESNNEIYYDPNSSEDDKTTTEEFYDPSSISDSEFGMFIVNGNVTKPPGRRRIEIHPISFEECSENSENAINGHCDHEEDIINGIGLTNGDSQNSLNDIMSLSDMISPSQESHTFDFDTVPHGNRSSSPSIVSTNYPPSSDNIFIQKSLPDYEPVPGCSKISEFNVKKTPTDEIDSVNDHPTGNSPNDCNDDDDDDDKIVLSEVGKRGEDFRVANKSLEEESLEGVVGKTEQLSQNGVDLWDYDAAVRVDSMSRLLGKLSISECSNGEKKNDEENVDDNPDEMDDSEEKPRRLRRCSSLKTGKTPPGTPGRKKSVRFADVLGLDLADVRTFLDEIPKIPNSAYSDLIYDDIFQKDSSPSLYGTSPTTNGSIPGSFTRFSGSQGTMTLEKMLVPLFQQPGGLPNFLDLVRDRQVCLENVLVKDPITMCISGSVRVRNLDFHKSVHIRYSLDSWKNFADLQGLYVNGSCDGFSDKFTFHLYCHTLRVGQRLELAVRFQCKGVQYWDNNAGANYCFQCLPTTPSVSYIPITTPKSNNCHDWAPAFY